MDVAVIRARDEAAPRLRTAAGNDPLVQPAWRFVVGLLFAGLLAAEAVLESPGCGARRAVGGWGVFLALAALAAARLPERLDLFTLPLRMLSMTFATSTLSEWQAADFQNFQPLEVWIMLAILGACLLV